MSEFIEACTDNAALRAFNANAASEQACALLSEMLKTLFNLAMHANLRVKQITDEVRSVPTMLCPNNWCLDR